jgi:hypothetical protein
VGADLRLAAGAPGAQGAVEETRQHRAAAACGGRGRKRLTYLTQDLGLAHDQRFDAGGNPEQVPDCLGPLEMKEVDALDALLAFDSGKGALRSFS